MINPGQFVLELVLVVAALALSHWLPSTRHPRFVVVFSCLTGIVNAVFYYVVAGPLLLARGFDRSVLATTVTVEMVRWGILAFVLGRLAVRLQDGGLTSGFNLLRSPSRLPRDLAFGTAAGVVASIAMYALSYIELHLGYLEALPWPGANGEALDLRLAIGAGFRNLVGEEIFARLGAQSVVLYVFRRWRYGSPLAVIASSLYFELWHNPFEAPQFLNFTGSCVFGWVYQKRGYESAAVAHCVADWLVLAILPLALF
ncbi:MAG TPA: CPBP family glutamic-type intramembrane protease [Vicinamibacterales bacterium]|nr:CPBP family glutamic-type intramembrane protease [Vicinamibacterales bacterium]